MEVEVIVITASGAMEGEVERITNLFDHGLETLHIRKPKLSSTEISELITSFPEKYRSRIVIHGHYKLARKFGLKGYHLRRRHRSNSWRNKLKRFLLKVQNPRALVCTTFHSVQSLKECESSFDYVLLNNVFNDETRFNYQEPSGMNLIRSVIKKSDQRVFAVGGIRPDRIEMMKSIGFHGMGVSSSYICQFREDYLNEFQKFFSPRIAT
jgi:thiamine-phosphate pyrophosphorylase